MPKVPCSGHKVSSRAELQGRNNWIRHGTEHGAYLCIYTFVGCFLIFYSDMDCWQVDLYEGAAVCSTGHALPPIRRPSDHQFQKGLHLWQISSNEVATGCSRTRNVWGIVQSHSLVLIHIYLNVIATKLLLSCHLTLTYFLPFVLSNETVYDGPRHCPRLPCRRGGAFSWRMDT